MDQYLLIRLLLLVGLALVGWTLVRPVRSAEHLALRRLAMGAIIAFAGLAILVPTLTNRVAALLGVARGTNLLVYLLVLAVLAQAVSQHRREVATERRIAELARAVALLDSPRPADGKDEERRADAQSQESGK